MTLILRRDSGLWVVRDHALGRTTRLPLVPPGTPAGVVVRAVQIQYPNEPVGVESASIGPYTEAAYGKVVIYDKSGLIRAKT